MARRLDWAGTRRPDDSWAELANGGSCHRQLVPARCRGAPRKAKPCRHRRCRKCCGHHSAWRLWMASWWRGLAPAQGASFVLLARWVLVLNARTPTVAMADFPVSDKAAVAKFSQRALNDPSSPRPHHRRPRSEDDIDGLVDGVQAFLGLIVRLLMIGRGGQPCTAERSKAPLLRRHHAMRQIRREPCLDASIHPPLRQSPVGVHSRTMIARLCQKVDRQPSRILASMAELMRIDAARRPSPIVVVFGGINMVCTGIVKPQNGQPICLR